ncbi:hypothetical protein HUB98_05365 [Paenibacillus barcinonensis]|uniref:Uncharacterized protein n=1 Tax=Paenibacillus barcinonensis TaxID=198119 RepID=A0A2V4VVT3_PAEBA|nr:hypothetical protein [Paenibacillus barcinonensis]PYE51416.1 hypothetical protein DFQ00_102210 [Paenibacillus barcinonensis]QKS55812.1 hypothetical protein HUB98_05365 [Paenibacillus barcinonensis]
MAKKMIIKGVGTFMAKRYPTDPMGAIEVVTLGTLQDLKIDLNVELEDIFGGDGLFAIDVLVKSKSIEVSATDAKFDLDAIQLMMGSTVQEQVKSYVWVLNEQAVATTGTANSGFAEVKPAFGSTIYEKDAGIAVRLKDSNTLLKQLPSKGSAVKADEFFYDAANGLVVLNAVHIDKEIVMNYKRDEVVDMVDLLVDEVPFPISVIHHGTFQQKDGTFAGVETELYMCRAKGTFSINAQRAAASASAISLQILDPERPDGKIGSIKRFSATSKI